VYSVIPDSLALPALLRIYICTSKLNQEWTWAVPYNHPYSTCYGLMAWFWLQLTNAPSDNAWACVRVSTCQEYEQQKVWI